MSLPSASPDPSRQEQPDPLGSPLARAVFEAAAEGLLVLDAEGTVLAMNAAFEGLYGLDAAVCVGAHFTQFAKDLEVRRLDRAVAAESWVTQRALCGERIVGVLQSIRSRVDGREFIARCGAVPLHEGGRFVATTITVEDVTEETRALQSVEAALSAAEVGVYQIDLIQDTVRGDANFARLYGLSEGEAAGGPRARLYDSVHPDDMERVMHAIGEATLTGEAHEVEYRIVRPDGEIRWLLSRGRAQMDDRGFAVQRLGSIVDVTGRKEAEEASRNQTARYKAVLEAERAVTAADGDYAALIRAAVHEARRLTGADGASLEIQEGGEMVYEAASGMAEGFVGLRLQASESLSGRTAREGVTTRSDDTEVDGRVDREACRRIGLRSMVLVPLRYDERSFGVLKVMSARPSAFGEGDAQAVELLSGFLGAAIGRSRALRALRESELRFRAAVGAIGVLWTNSAEGRMEGEQPGWTSLTGQSRDEYEGYGWSEAVHPEDAGPTVEAWNEAVREKKTFQFEHRVRRHDGEWRRFSVRAVPVLDGHGEVREWVGVHLDVTAEREAVEALRRAGASLERRVAERTAELQTANDALESFTHHVAHDLRSPLRSIVSTSRMAIEDHGDLLPDEVRDMLERQARSAKRMALLIDDLLSMARLSRTEAKRSPTDVTALAREAADEARAAHPESHVRVEVEEGLHAEADSRLLKLVLVNLIENGVKYSPRGGTVRVGRRPDGAFFVSDEGIGIDPRYFDRVFEPFQRLHREEEFKGTGIGLSNVKQIVSLHDGKVWVESEPGKGSVFFFTVG